MPKRLTAAGVGVTVHDEGVLEFDYGTMPKVDLDQAMATLEATEAWLIAEGVAMPLPSLVQMGQVAHLTREARQYFAEGATNARLTNRVALIASNAIGRVIGNFFLGLNRSPRPTQLFTDRKAAWEWLLREP